MKQENEIMDGPDVSGNKLFFRYKGPRIKLDRLRRYRIEQDIGLYGIVRRYIIDNVNQTTYKKYGFTSVCADLISSEYARRIREKDDIEL